MSCIALVFPVLPGKDAKAIANEMKTRPREYEQSRRRMGITLERVYQQHTPMGDYVTAYIESEGDLLEKMAALPSSDLAIDQYFVRAVKEIHGADLSQPLPGPAPENVAAWSDPAAERRGRGMAFCAPLIPGETERARAFAADAYHRDEFAASRRRVHQTVELVTLHSTPQGDIVGIYVESDDPAKSNAEFTASQDRFDLWFRDELTKIFPPAVDFSRPIEGVEEILDSTEIADLSLGKAA